ncbi:cupin domain-containing protein [Mangrovimicrobium sediminis]|uniref:Cupin domain-containing protein n=1 Tax=Mangrovimicrobium sediminis TaxID=2562682 RepID=A0A4Z0LVP3_9GAMM|nr:cupin domain-containing protein [Haliea sp. SAOS-164]TGD71267.1 cupin domain-containing protein [Haliea sp. SAOS-164]
MSETTEQRQQLKIYRASEAPGLVEKGCMQMQPMTEVQVSGLKRLVQSGYLEGDELKVLVDMPGFALTYAWLKKDYPLMRHSHDSDCMYYVIAGSLKLGTEELGAMDCFFVPAGVPYTYVPGADGVEVLEIRHKPAFDFVNLTHSENWWDKAEQTCAANREHWKNAHKPSSS